MVENRIVATVDLNEDIKKTYLNTIFATKDSNAHQVDVYLYRGKEPVTLKGTVLVKGYFIRYSENVTAILNGTVDGNKVSVTLEPGCYNKPGQFALVIKVTTGNEVSTVFYGEGSMCVGQTDEIFYEDYIIMDVEEMLSHIKEMEEATADAREATEAATTATQLLETEAQTQITRIEQRAETLEAHIISEANRQVAKVETATQEFLTDNPDVVGPQGEPGVGIQSVEQTTTSTADGGSNVVTVTTTDSKTSTITVKNGSKGSKGDKGDTPQKGTDYYTEADRTEMVSLVKAALGLETWTFTLADGSTVEKTVSIV